MLTLPKLSDKSRQQRQGRTNGAIRSTADRRPMGEDPSLAAAGSQIPARRTTTGKRSQSPRRHFMDFAQRRSLAGFARGVSFARNLLAAASGLGRARHLAHHLARIVSGRQFRSSQKRGSQVGKTKRGKGTKWMVVVDGEGLPLGKQLYSASPHEARLAEETLASIRVARRHRAGRPRQKALRVIADRAYDSDPLRERLAARGIELIAPHRWNRRRWKVERTLAWLGNFRRLVVRYDRSITIYEAFFHIACFMIVLRRVLK